MSALGDKGKNPEILRQLGLLASCNGDEMVTQTSMKDRGAVFLVPLLLSKPQWRGGISATGSR